MGKNVMSGSSTEHGYRVEAATLADPPIKVGDQIFSTNWSEVQFKKIELPLGVRTHGPGRPGLATAGLFSYEAAEALRWWFLANGGMKVKSLKTRLVHHEVKISWEVEKLGATSETEVFQTAPNDTVVFEDKKEKRNE